MNTKVIEQSKPLLYLIVGLAGIFVIIFGLRSSASILNPILLAIVITIAVSPLPAMLTARGVPGWLSLVLTFALVLGLIGFVLFLIVLTAGRLVEELPRLQEMLAAQQDAVNTDPERAILFPWLTSGALVDGLQAILISQRSADLITTFVSVLVRGISQAFIVLLIFAFMLASTLALPSSDRLGLNPDQPAVNQFVQLTAQVRQYVNLTALINLLVAIGNTILLLILGIGPAFLWGTLSWFMGFIPAVGFWVAMIPPLLIALVQGDYITAGIVFVGYALINGGVENLIKPRFLGQNLSISPLVVAVSLIVWAWLLGAVGAILAIPMTLLLLSVLESFESSRWLATLMRTAGNQEPGERQDALSQLKSSWQKLRDTIAPPNLPPPPSDLG
jgi:predicted PurR-regulated permease PerM